MLGEPLGGRGWMGSMPGKLLPPGGSTCPPGSHLHLPSECEIQEAGPFSTKKLRSTKEVYHPKHMHSGCHRAQWSPSPQSQHGHRHTCTHTHASLCGPHSWIRPTLAVPGWMVEGVLPCPGPHPFSAQPRGGSLGRASHQ